MKKPVYDDKAIETLKDLEAIRLRPNMYVGDPRSYRSILQIIKEVVDNSIDEWFKGECSEIDIVLDVDTSNVVVVDNGEGIPQNSLVTVLTKLHSGGKFKTGEDSVYKVSTGTFGIGISATNALSSRLECYSKRVTRVVCAKFRDGGKIVHAEKKVTKINVPYGEDTMINRKSWKQGTVMAFQPDYRILTYGKLPIEKLIDLLIVIPELCANLKIQITIVMNGQSMTQVFHNKIGLKSRVEGNDLYFKKYLVNDEGVKTDGVEAWLKVVDGDMDSGMEGYVNTIPIPEGTHMIGFWKAFKKALAPYTKKVIPPISAIRSAVTGVLNVRSIQPVFIGQIKEKLEDPSVEESVYNISVEQLEKVFKKNADFANRVVNTAIAIYNLELEQKSKLKVIRNVEADSKKGKLPLGLVTCDSRDIKSRELYILEGESGGGVAKAARDKDFQEVLSLKGKPANAETNSFETILKGSIKDIVLSVGNENPELGRVGRVIFLADADPDGHHITTLLITCFIKLFPKWIQEGLVYTVDAPLFHAIHKNKRYYGNTIEEVIDQTSKGVNVQRLKGWGEGRVQDLKYIAMDPKSRKLIKIVEDSSNAFPNVLKIMGKDTKYRKELFGIDIDV